MRLAVAALCLLVGCSGARWFPTLPPLPPAAGPPEWVSAPPHDAAELGRLELTRGGEARALELGQALGADALTRLESPTGLLSVRLLRRGAGEGRPAPSAGAEEVGPLSPPTAPVVRLWLTGPWQDEAVARSVAIGWLGLRPRTQTWAVDAQLPELGRVAPGRPTLLLPRLHGDLDPRALGVSGAETWVVAHGTAPDVEVRGFTEESDAFFGTGEDNQRTGVIATLTLTITEVDPRTARAVGREVIPCQTSTRLHDEAPGSGRDRLWREWDGRYVTIPEAEWVRRIEAQERRRVIDEAVRRLVLALAP